MPQSAHLLSAPNAQPPSGHGSARPGYTIVFFAVHGDERTAVPRL